MKSEFFCRKAMAGITLVLIPSAISSGNRILKNAQRKKRQYSSGSMTNTHMRGANSRGLKEINAFGVSIQVASLRKYCHAHWRLPVIDLSTKKRLLLLGSSHRMRLSLLNH